MSGDDEKSGPMFGEVVPPSRHDAPSLIDPPSGGIPLFNRIRYRERRKELEEYLALLKAGNALVREINETVTLRETHHRGLVRSERIDDLRRIESLKIDAELDAALNEALSKHEDARDNELARRARRANLEADAIEAEQRLAARKNPQSPPGPKAKQSEAEWIASEVKRLRDREKEIIAAFVGEVGSEEQLTDEDRALIARVRMATRDEIEKLFEGLAR